MSASHNLRVDRIACTGHGACAELVPELVQLDEWGYPIIEPTAVPAHLLRLTRRAVTTCPALALRLERAAGPAPRATGG